jgi:hypothetical protein
MEVDEAAVAQAVDLQPPQDAAALELVELPAKLLGVDAVEGPSREPWTRSRSRRIRAWTASSISYIARPRAVSGFASKVAPVTGMAIPELAERDLAEIDHRSQRSREAGM